MHLNKHSWNERTKGQKIRINEPERNGMYFGKEWLCKNRWQGQQVELKKKNIKDEGRTEVGSVTVEERTWATSWPVDVVWWGFSTTTVIPLSQTHTHKIQMLIYSNWLIPTSSKTRQNLENLMWRQCRVRLILSARDERGTKVSWCHETHLTLSKDLLGRVYFFSFFEVDRWKWELQLPVACSYQASFTSGLLIKIGF